MKHFFVLKVNNFVTPEVDKDEQQKGCTDAKAAKNNRKQACIADKLTDRWSTFRFLHEVSRTARNCEGRSNEAARNCVFILQAPAEEWEPWRGTDCGCRVTVEPAR